MDAVIEQEVKLVAPKIGTAWQGGIYAGVVAGIDGAPDYHLVHAPVESELVDLTWTDAMEAAKQPINGFLDWSLPDRREARLLYINTPEGFDVDDWYWTSTPDAGNTGYAWVQSFNGGNQGDDRKSSEHRARAVRRLIIL